MKRNVFIAYPAFFSSFRELIDNLKVVKNPIEIRKNDLVIFSGGEDINPKIYGEENISSYSINSRRDKIEKRIFEHCIEVGAKMIGVCRGHQLILALHGAKLIQDIKPPHPSYHELFYHDDFYKKLVGENVNSLHHQGVHVNNLPENFKLIASFDDVIEVAISENCFTIQSHPEFSGNVTLFKYLIKEL